MHTNRLILTFSLESNHGSVVFTAGDDRLRIAFVTPAIVRITLTRGKSFLLRASLIVSSKDRFTGHTLSEDDAAFTIAPPEFTLVVNKTSGAIRYLDAPGNLLLAEPETGGKSLTAKKSPAIFSAKAP
jgi:alpha-D-xyloside xylohydrolase